jgi:hypothetical protein
MTRSVPVIEEVPIRIHYLIQEGRIALPACASIEIIRRKREMQSMLQLLQRLYFRLLGQGKIELAERVFHCYRGLGELRFGDLFGEYGFPDEDRAGQAKNSDWQTEEYELADKGDGEL